MNERVYRILGYDVMLRRLADCAVSASGREACLAIQPEVSKKKVQKMLDHTREAESIYLSASSSALISFDNCSSEAARLRSGAGLSCGELLRCMRLFKAAKHAKQNIRKDEEKKQDGEDASEA